MPAPAPDFPPGKRDRTLKFWGLRLFVRECGEGYPLLLINGLGANLEMWGPLEDRLTRFARTISFDAPGMGRSRPTPIVLTHLAHAKIICRLLDSLGVQQCDVLGYSLGGTFAQQLARVAPERVRRLALVGTSCGWGSVAPEGRVFALVATPLRYYSRFVFEHTSKLLDGVDPDPDSETLLAQADARLAYPPSLTGYAQQFIAGATWSSLHWVGTLSTPTLVLAGEQDRLVPAANGVQLAHHLPLARLHVLPGEGHLMLFDPASASHPLLVDFFSATDPEQSQAWLTGALASDEDVRQALRSASGAQPVNGLSAIYRNVGLPTVKAFGRRRALG